LSEVLELESSGVEMEDEKEEGRDDVPCHHHHLYEIAVVTRIEKFKNQP
jgi:hypothetical protein